ncbi:hypothetical protein A0H81_13095 [Grifola frondosa]|uniref:Uncharacterized protein n=1 Tax=Grifola frondosa TaxID=5627 RepID=A0A1C7LQ04_GRIFR|nr:hypothetical protein A0H81_13095 [Grifola frondosa]
MRLAADQSALGAKYSVALSSPTTFELAPASRLLHPSSGTRHDTLWHCGSSASSLLQLTVFYLRGRGTLTSLLVFDDARSLGCYVRTSGLCSVSSRAIGTLLALAAIGTFVSLNDSGTPKVRHPFQFTGLLDLVRRLVSILSEYTTAVACTLIIHEDARFRPNTHLLSPGGPSYRATTFIHPSVYFPAFARA